MALTFNPLNDYVVVQLIDPTKTDELIVLPEDIMPPEQPTGTVVAVGPGRLVDTSQELRVPMEVKPGDNVLFYRNASQKIELDGVEYYVMSETNIFLILREDTDGK